MNSSRGSDVDANSETLDSDSQKPLIDDRSVSIVASINQDDGSDVPDHRGNTPAVTHATQFIVFIAKRWPHSPGRFVYLSRVHRFFHTLRHCRGADCVIGRYANGITKKALVPM